MFSTFIVKELSSAKNIKNRINRQNVLKLLTKIKSNIINIKNNKGLLVFCGIDEYNKEILEIIEPEIKCNIFYYKCKNKFDTEYINIYFKKYNGTIIFSNGNETIIYIYDNEFKKIKYINGNLQKRHKKGGQSQKRFERLVEESRKNYITRIIDYLNNIKTDNNWLFGSFEITNMILKKTNIKLNNGGFLNFNDKTINNSFLEYFKQKTTNDNIFKKFIYYLEIDPDYLDFDPSNFDKVQYIIMKNKNMENDKQLYLNKNSKFYEKLFIFDYIGLKYYKNDLFIE